MSALNLAAAYSPARRLAYLGTALTVGICAAGFWNFRVVDGLGSDVIAWTSIGDYRGLGHQFGSLGPWFGFVFAMVSGVAATFTACNCVVFAMIPGLSCTPDVKRSLWATFQPARIMLTWVVIVTAVYGAFVGWLGPSGAAALNLREVRFAQAGIVFSVVGIAMVIWALIELGLFETLSARCSPTTRAFFAQTTTKAALMGAMIGAFAIGRPYPVFREFLLYASQTQQPSYGAAVMAVQGVGQVLVMLGVLSVVLAGGQRRLRAWSTRNPYQMQLLSALSLAAGGAYFVFYWGLARTWPSLGRWGFQLGWYN